VRNHIGISIQSHTDRQHAGSILASQFSARRKRTVLIMIQEGQLFCDGCKGPISLEGKFSLELLIEIVQDSPDRHYCEKCSDDLKIPPLSTEAEHE